ncbi:MAG: hypothetical protein ABI562_08880 [Chloroflexota bacterium]
MAIILVALLATGCAAATPSTSVSLSAATAPARTSGPDGSAGPSSTIEPSASAEASFDATQPPPASLAVEGGDPVIGQLGTFMWGDGGSDSPWLPGAPIVAASGERLGVAVGGGVAVAHWSARRVAAGTSDGTGAVALGSGPGPAAFDAPPIGAWSVAVTLDFADNLGSATYYWAITVR